MYIEIFGLYKQLLPLYEMDIRPRRYTSSKNPHPGKISHKEEIELMQNLWTPGDQRLLERINKDIVSEPTLDIPDPYQRFYIRK